MAVGTGDTDLEAVMVGDGIGIPRILLVFKRASTGSIILTSALDR